MPLPDRPNLEYLKKLAKDRLHDLRRSDPSARLADAQLAAPRSAPPDAAPELVEEFFGAVNRGDEATLGRMLAAQPGLVNARHPDGTTPLLAAADHNKPGVIALLLHRGGNPGSIYAHSAHTPLSWAITAGSFEAAQALVQGGVEPDLYCAAGLGDVQAIESFFDADGSLEDGASTTGSSRYRPDGSRLPCPPASPREIIADALYIACRNGREEAVRALLAHGPDLSFRAFAGGTALHWAYFGGARGAVEALLRAGADATVRDDEVGCTPRAFGISWAAHVGWVTKVRQRLADDPTLVDVMDGGHAPLHLAAKAGQLGVVKALLETGANASLRDSEGKTALDLARARPDHAGCVKVVEWLTLGEPDRART